MEINVKKVYFSLSCKYLIELVTNCVVSENRALFHSYDVTVIAQSKS